MTVAAVATSRLRGRHQHLHRSTPRSDPARLGRPDPHVAVTSVPADPESIEDLASAGIDEVVFRLPTDPGDVVLEAVGRLSQLITTLG